MDKDMRDGINGIKFDALFISLSLTRCEKVKKTNAVFRRSLPNAYNQITGVYDVVEEQREKKD